MDRSNNRGSVIVIGGGPGGYVAAIRAAQLGANVTLVEKKHVGGTCLNVGCIPTKALLHPAEIANSAREGAGCGVHVTIDAINWQEVLAFKNSIVKKLTGGVSGLLKGSGVKVIKGEAKFIKPKAVEITLEDGSHQMLEADRFIIATGSVPVMPPIEGLRTSKFVVDSTGLLSMEEMPKSMVIIGGGVIGIEFACALTAFGCKVTIVEALPVLAPTLDKEISQMVAKQLKNQGVELMLEHKVVSVSDGETEAEVKVDNNGEIRSVSAEKVLCAVGRRSYTDNLNAEAVGIKCEKNKILVNEYLETNIPGVYAIGDCVGQVMLAHTASAQGEVAAENAMGEHKRYRPNCVPSCIYSLPETAAVGITEEQAKEQGVDYRVGRFPLAANGRALIANGGEGMVKVIIGNELDEILGVHILGAHATELIAEAALSISMEATALEITDTIHSHPTVAEAIREAVLAADSKAIHIPNKKKKG